MPSIQYEFPTKYFPCGICGRGLLMKIGDDQQYDFASAEDRGAWPRYSEPICRDCLGKKNV